MDLTVRRHLRVGVKREEKILRNTEADKRETKQQLGMRQDREGEAAEIFVI